jgi:hypothetical protein
MNVQARVRFLVLWIAANSISLGISLSLGNWIESVTLRSTYDFTWNFSGFYSVIVASLILGMMQWAILNKYQTFLPVRWVLGAMIGFCSIVGFGWLFWIGAIIIHFNGPSTFKDNMLRLTISQLVAGQFGGAILGAIQFGSSRLRQGQLREMILGVTQLGSSHILSYWAMVNSFAWAVGWSIGRVCNYAVTYSPIYWHIQNLPEPAKIAIHSGTLGLLAGLVSSAITGFPLWRLLQRDQIRS